MKYALTIVLFFATLRGYSQNLVPNWSFEDLDSCQTMPLPSGSNIFYTPYWFSPFSFTTMYSGGGVEFYSGCAELIEFLPPHTSNGYQFAYEGNNYAGIYLIFNDNREYIEIGLLESLLENKRYCIKFPYDFGDSSSVICDGLSVHFSNDSLMQLSNTLDLIPVSPQLSLPDSFLTIDTTNWLLFSDIFVASGGERYMTIGNFTPTDSIYWQQIRPDWLNSTRCYMFLDAIEVFECDSLGNPVSISQVQSSSEIKFPNPTDASFDIDLVDDASTVTVYDAVGRLVYQQVAQSHSLTVQTQHWSQGFYILQVTNPNHLRKESFGQAVIKKLVVQH